MNSAFCSCCSGTGSKSVVMW